MNRANWDKIFKNNLKLVLCVAGIIAVVVVLVAARPVQSQKNINPRLPSAVASAHSSSNISTLGQAAPANSNSRPAATTGVNQAVSSSLQTSTPGYTSPASPVVSPSNPPVITPPVVEPEPLYPIDPNPCKNYGPYIRTGCGCGAIPMENSSSVCWPRCPAPGSGSEMMCAYLDN